MAIEARARQAVTLLLGLRDPYSPLSLVDTAVIRLIMQFRCAPVYVTTADGKQETRDPDSSQLQSFRGMPSLVYANRAQAWHRNGLLHRDGDLPAEVQPNGDMCWYRNGELHRDGDMPSVVYANGAQAWHRNGKLHRDGDLPAEVWADGSTLWYRNGKCHRDGDLPAVMWSDGFMYWYRDGIEYHPRTKTIHSFV